MRPLELSTAHALVHGHRPRDARWAPDYPTDSALVAASIVLTAEAEGRSLGPWTAYQIVVRETGCAVGGCGFMQGPPDADGDVYVAFSIVDSHRGHGYAAEALHALIAWARSRPEVSRVRAETAATNDAGLRVYDDAGMRRAGSDGELVFFEA